MAELKRTPLFDAYAQYGGKTIDFGGWELPVQFSSIKDEHDAVRNRAGLFDVSHMGEIFVEGADALAYLQKILSNDVSKIAVGGAQYSAMCYENGGVVDDLLTYRLAENTYLLCVNAANIEKDFEWMQQNAAGDVTITNRSDEFAQIALQGPLAEEVLQALTATDLKEIKYFKFQDNVEVAGYKVLVSRSGYTGEDGFELYGTPKAIVALWHKILESEHVVPTGLGARDTLRFEACLPLYGQELSKDISPLEAGIGFAVKLQKEPKFIGQEALIAQKEAGLARKSVGVEMIGKGIPRHGYKVFKDGVEIGEVTTGTQSPLTKRNIGLALLKTEFTELGTEVEIEIRGKLVPAVTVATPFYKR
ncbi:glycine cleavage system aminomethyltransferase GcvT [Metasolibacillus sp.]|uniref:glycine cleavage system aminomethyltransferase GcvT n=1 Tax=Metasolibacillus sp. TaxID=2703680 RepID=UPI0025E33C3D|nr:glycine cleavage system aminomethyltransferase GcvT [Metasolibacillus sp.]MCT6922647.1 glycine cleavage system aminomethyltransferase GcvT [Metasolibacillus sp.]MCT6939014.1 glycine cleavage system aminomethyltransferase GcvT [Metasolibacillus sp.]